MDRIVVTEVKDAVVQSTKRHFFEVALFFFAGIIFGATTFGPWAILGAVLAFGLVVLAGFVGHPTKKAPNRGTARMKMLNFLFRFQKESRCEVCRTPLDEYRSDLRFGPLGIGLVLCPPCSVRVEKLDDNAALKLLARANT